MVRKKRLSHLNPSRQFPVKHLLHRRALTMVRKKRLSHLNPSRQFPMKPQKSRTARKTWARAAREGSFAGTDETSQPDGTLRCPADHSLYAETRRRERDG